MRALFLALLLATPAAAQETPAAAQDNLGALLLLSDEVCDDVPSNPQAPYLILSTIGRELGRGGLPMREDQPLNVYVVGEQSLVDRIYPRRTSATRDVDAIRIAGTVDRADFAGVTCGFRQTSLHDFEPGEGTFVLEIADPASGEVKPIREPITFPVRTAFRAGASFGPMASLLPARSYATVADGAGGQRLAETGGGDLDVHYVLALSYYLGAARTRDSIGGASLFLGVPVSDGALGDNAFGGLAVDLGTVLVAHAGVRLGRTDRIVAEQAALVGQPVPEGFTPTTERVWTPAFAVGVSVDAAAAARVFGKTVSALVP